MNLLEIKEFLEKKFDQESPDYTPIFDSLSLSFTSFSKVFAKEVTLNFYYSDRYKEESLTNEKVNSIRESSIVAIDDFFGLAPTELAFIKERIWDDCLYTHQDSKSSSDGGVTWEEHTLEDNLKESEILGREDALTKWSVHEVYFSDDPNMSERSFIISIATEWDEEHTLNFVYTNGKLTEEN